MKKTSPYTIITIIFVSGMLFGYLLGNRSSKTPELSSDITPPTTKPVNTPPAKPKTEAICEHNGKQYKNGESFKDDCNTCGCENGQVVCTLMACE